MARNTIREPRETMCVPDDHEYITVTLDGPPVLSELVDMILRKMHPTLVIGRGGGALTPTRDDPNRVGYRYMNFVYNTESVSEIITAIKTALSDI